MERFMRSMIDQLNLSMKSGAATQISPDSQKQKQPENPYSKQIKDLEETVEKLSKEVASSLDKFHPIGSIYCSEDPTEPETLFGGKWERIEDRFLLASGSSYKAGDTGGNEKHKHTEGDFRAMIGAATGAPSTLNYVATGGSNPNTGATRTGTYTIVGASYRTGDGFAHYTPVVGYTSTDSNMPPYMAVYVWKRTA